MYTLIKASGNELLPTNFASFCQLVQTEQKTAKKIILVFGGGVQIDKRYEEKCKEPRPKKNGMGITTQQVLDYAVLPTYHDHCQLLQNAFPTLSIVNPSQIQGKKKSDFGWVLAPEKIELKECDFQAIGFVGKDEENNDCNINADDIVEILCRQERVEKVIFLTKSGGVYDHNHRIIDFLSQNDINKLLQNTHPKAKISDGMLKKCEVIANILKTVPRISIRSSTNEKQQTICENLPAILPVYASKPTPFTHGKGSFLFTQNGEKYLDMMSGVAVNMLGHSDDHWIQAVKNQLDRCTHISNYYISEPQQLLAQKLVEMSFADQVFLSNSGTEANEAALKFAKKIAKQKDEGKIEIIAFQNGFHGRSMGSLSTTHNERYRTPFAPLVPGITFCEYNNIDDFSAHISEKTAAVIIEPMQGEGGIFSASKEFLQEVRTQCDKHHAILIFDEVQCGLGRTGKLFAYEHFSVLPDILTLAKPLAGGIPIGATLVSGVIGRQIAKGDHGSTFGGNPLACASALHVLSRLEKTDFLETVNENAHYFLKKLKNISSKKIKEIRAFGLMIGIECTENVQPIIEKAYEKKLLIISAGEKVLRLLPPLNVSKAEIDKACAILKDIFQDIEK